MHKQYLESRARRIAGIEQFRLGNHESAYRLFEDAHILGQRFTLEHTLSHWWMLRVALKTRDVHEFFGQIPRIIASLIFSKVWVPVGNSGRTKVSAFKTMPVPNHLREFIQ